MVVWETEPGVSIAYDMVGGAGKKVSGCREPPRVHCGEHENDEMTRNAILMRISDGRK